MTSSMTASSVFSLCRRALAREAGSVMRVLGAAVALTLVVAPSSTQTSVRSGGEQVFDSAWTEATDFVEIAAGAYHTVARRADGSVVALGINSDGQCEVPPLPPGVGLANLPLFGGTLVSFGGLALQAPVVAGGGGQLSLTLNGMAVVTDLVLQSVFLDALLPQGLAFPKAVLARFGQ